MFPYGVRGYAGGARAAFARKAGSDLGKVRPGFSGLKWRWLTTSRPLDRIKDPT